MTAETSALWLKIGNNSCRDAACSAGNRWDRLALRLRRAFMHHGTAQ